jgi:hypothetical protein
MPLSLPSLLPLLLVPLLPSALAQSFPPYTSPNSTYGKPLRFRSDGTFKIVEVSDVHFTNNSKCNDLSPSQQQFPCSDANYSAFLRSLIALEDPDVILFTGDSVCGGGPGYGQGAIDGLLADLVSPNNTVPWALVEGNHDGESGLDYQAVAEYVLTKPMGLNQPNPDNVYGNTNFVLPVLGADGSPDANSSLFTLYFVDSNSYSTLEAAGGGYGWVKLSQISWFAEAAANVSAAAAAEGRPGPPPALAFQHIPLPEHEYLIAANVSIVGQYQEAVCCPGINSGLFTQYLEAGDVKAVTVGHDHTNDYCGQWDGIWLCYDGHGSYGASGYGRPDWPIRARVWHLSAFGSLVETYKRLDTLAGGIPVPNATIDLQAIFSQLPLEGASTSQTTGSSPDCPPGSNAVHTDMNSGAGGSYSWLCLLPSTAASTRLVVNLTVAVGTEASPPVCPPASGGWAQMPGNIKEGTKSADVMNLCVQTASTSSLPHGTPVVTDVKIAQGGATYPVACPTGYSLSSPNLSGGVGTNENLCARLEPWSDAVAARAAGNAVDKPRRPAHGTWGYSSSGGKAAADEGAVQVGADGSAARASGGMPRRRAPAPRREKPE